MHVTFSLANFFNPPPVEDPADSGVGWVASRRPRKRRSPRARLRAKGLAWVLAQAPKRKGRP